MRKIPLLLLCLGACGTLEEEGELENEPVEMLEAALGEAGPATCETELEPNDRAREATTVCSENHIAGTLSGLVDRDWFRISGQPKSTVTVKISGLTVAAQAALYRINEQGRHNRLDHAKLDASGNIILKRRVSQKGDLLVFVMGRGEDFGQTPYRVDVDFQP